MKTKLLLIMIILAPLSGFTAVGSIAPLIMPADTKLAFITQKMKITDAGHKVYGEGHLNSVDILRLKQFKVLVRQAENLHNAGLITQSQDHLALAEQILTLPRKASGVGVIDYKD